MFGNEKAPINPPPAGLGTRNPVSTFMSAWKSRSAGVVRARRRSAIGRDLEQLEGRELLSSTQLSDQLVDRRGALLGHQVEFASIRDVGGGGRPIAAAGSLRAARGELVALPIKAISLTFAPITISLPGVGPVSTGPITASLQANRRSYALFDTRSRMVQTDQFLQFDFPLLRAIGSPPPTLEFREIGPVTVGVNPRTRQMVALGALRGGGVFDPGSVFQFATMLVNDTTNIFGTVNPPIPSPPTPPVAFPGPFQPFSPGSVPDPRPLPAGFRPATDRQVRALLAREVMVRSAFSIGGFLRALGQAGDLPFGGMGRLGPST